MKIIKKNQELKHVKIICYVDGYFDINIIYNFI